MQAIILAAGMGKRLRSYTKDATKCYGQGQWKNLNRIYDRSACVESHRETRSGGRI